MGLTIADVRKVAGDAYGVAGEQLVDLWDRYNVDLFDGRLQPILITRTKVFAYGGCIGLTSINSGDRHLQVKRFQDKVCHEQAAVLLHEMVHQALHERGSDPNTPGESTSTGRPGRHDAIDAARDRWLAGNHKPRIVGTDAGIWRRWKLIPFEVSFKGREEKGLLDTLKAEGPGILKWAICGCMEWQQMGLSEPARVQAAVDEYQQEEDRLSTWLAERCVTGPDFRARSSGLYDDYKRWAEGSGEFVLSQTAWGKEMPRKGFERQLSNGIWYAGVALRAI